jgi:nucleoside-diphosphate-sugar epimerase
MRVLVRGGTGFIGSHLCNDSTKEVAYVLEMRDGGSSDKSANHVALSQQELSKA